jgi:molybdate transport system substrate-binding protein
MALHATHVSAVSAKPRSRWRPTLPNPSRPLPPCWRKPPDTPFGNHARLTEGCYNQIKNGAPFDVLLAADTATPEKLETEGLGQPGSRFTYATGKLVLWSAKANRVDNKGQMLKAADLGKVAYANPKLAPYGAATVQAMDKLGLTAPLAPKLVQGESIGQTFTFAATATPTWALWPCRRCWKAAGQERLDVGGAADAVRAQSEQDAVVMQKSATNEAAQALMQLLKSPNIKDLIRSYGYDL